MSHQSIPRAADIDAHQGLLLTPGCGGSWRRAAGMEPYWRWAHPICSGQIKARLKRGNDFMLKKLGFPILGLAAMLAFFTPTQAKAAHWGVGIGVAPAYP